MGFISVLVTIMIFGLIVVVHEFGHFIIAKKNGILVEEFAIGMGPLVYGKKRGDTLYSIRLLPVGGYCKMLSENEENNDKRAFSSKTVLQRMAVCFAGAAMNIILAYLIIFFIFSVSASTRGVFNTNTISVVREDTPAYFAGLKPGDTIISYNGDKINNQADINRIVGVLGTNEALLEFERNGEVFTLPLSPELIEDEAGEFIRVGVRLSKIGIFERNTYGTSVKRAGLLETFRASFSLTALYTRVVIGGIIDLITFRLSVDDFAGPIGVGQFVSSAMSESLREYGVWDTVLDMLNIAALLSANLAVFNLLPLPALDGGRLVFLIIEAIRKKPVTPEKEGLVHFVGLVLFLILAAFVAFKDILKFF